MKKIFESFEELAEVMTDGEGAIHLFNCPEHKNHNMDCISWQNGVMDFAEWLDHIGCKVEINDGEENFYDFISKRNKECNTE